MFDLFKGFNLIYKYLIVAFIIYLLHLFTNLDINLLTFLKVK